VYFISREQRTFLLTLLDMKPILEIQNIGKKYRIQHLAGGYLSLRERMANALKFERNTAEDFWALKDVSFEVQPGESIGIIGRNGAGKSTLLKILSKITPPTSGKIVSRGRIASLLEVGTGFHPELTGRENIFFNGSLLGMKRIEISVKFDEIVDFSGVEKFLDTPLKHYSSGMQLRLAFAVAAFLEPEILIIDEVLAVGDAEFQKKCMNKMGEVVREGRTIIFVSHNLSAVKNLCGKAILIENGTIRSEGQALSVLDDYVSSNLEATENSIDLSQIKRNNFEGALRFGAIKFEKSVLQFGENIVFSLVLFAELNLLLSDINIAIAINDSNGACLIHASNEFVNIRLGFHGDQMSYIVNITNNLRPGRYSITLFLRAKGIIQDWLTDVVAFTIEDGNPYGYSNTNMIQGLTLPEFSIIAT